VNIRYGHNQSGPDLQKTLLGHELAHWGSRVVYCDRPGRARGARGGAHGRAKSSCSYKGQHDKRFYNVLNQIHKKLGTPKENARALESRAGYKPPNRWLDHASYQAARRSPRRKRRKSKSLWDQIRSVGRKIVNAASTKRRDPHGTWMPVRRYRRYRSEISGRSLVDFQVQIARVLENKYKFSRGAAFAVAHSYRAMEAFRKGWSPQFAALTLARIVPRRQAA